MADSFRESSRSEWEHAGKKPADGHLVIGCLQRIADALETIATEFKAHTKQESITREQYRQALEAGLTRRPWGHV